MKNQEFKIDAEAGVVVFSQKAHDKMYTSKSKVDNIADFNVGIGQLIAMKRNEIEIRKDDIESMKDVAAQCEGMVNKTRGIERKLWSNFLQLAHDKIRMSQNHIHELRTDLEALYNKTYVVKPYEEILAEHRTMRKGSDSEKDAMRNMPCAVPTEIVEGTHIYEIVQGSVKLKEV